MNNIKLSDWKAIDAIHDAVDAYHLGEETDYDTLIKIKEILREFGFLEDE